MTGNGPKEGEDKSNCRQDNDYGRQLIGPRKANPGTAIRADLAAKPRDRMQAVPAGGQVGMGHRNVRGGVLDFLRDSDRRSIFGE
jgi:hypothetical protein